MEGQNDLLEALKGFESRIEPKTTPVGAGQNNDFLNALRNFGSSESKTTSVGVGTDKTVDELQSKINKFLEELGQIDNEKVKELLQYANPEFNRIISELKEKISIKGTGDADRIVNELIAELHDKIMACMKELYSLNNNQVNTILQYANPEFNKIISELKEQIALQTNGLDGNVDPSAAPGVEDGFGLDI